MLDRDRILSRVAELDGYLRELETLRPATRKEFDSIERKRACERLLQISIETTVGICKLFVVGLRLGLPADENDIFEKLETAKVVSPGMAKVLRNMKGFRNVLVHEYGDVNDDLVFLFLSTRTGDFTAFRRGIVEVLARNGRA